MTIIVENISKKYSIFKKNISNETIKEKLTHGLKNLFLNKRSSSDQNDFWALNDISFSLQEGDCLAIMGKNGAGKSTLLKIISRITLPTKGKITIKGRVASLLEVGTGFHPELSGKENIYLNGALLGMSKDEIKSKYDEIVHFSEMEYFLDTPVKRYSSGMFVRLAFSVAAHLEPEIMVIDEALAVGDASFKAKSLAKLEQVGKSGKTIIFVTHDLWSVKFCNKGILLDRGSIIPCENLDDCIHKYTNASLDQ